MLTRLSERIKRDMDPGRYKQYKEIFVSFLKNDTQTQQFHEMVGSLLGPNLIPFHNKLMRTLKTKLNVF